MSVGSGRRSPYRISGNGAITLQQARATDLGGSSQPVDLAQTADSHYLYQLPRGTGTVAFVQRRGQGACSPMSALGIVRGGLAVGDGASRLAVY